jgi:D-sedoheptulose 7-phosphate isomerase
MDELEAAIAEELAESRDVKDALLRSMCPTIAVMATRIRDCLHSGGKVLVFGNGGSAADAQHLAGELVGRFKHARRPLPALALTTDTSVITAIANDFDYRETFARQVQAFAGPLDAAIAISTSGNSSSTLRGVEAARQAGAFTIGLLGGDGGRIVQAVDLAVVVPSDNTQRIQEGHIGIIHAVCSIVDQHFTPMRGTEQTGGGYWIVDTSGPRGLEPSA